MMPTLHDLLQLHLQGLDGTCWVVSDGAFDPVDGQASVRHGGHVVILQEDDAVGVLNHGTATTHTHTKTKRNTPISFSLDTLSLD